MTRDSFVFYRSFYEALKCLDDDEMLKCFKAIASYALDGEDSDIQGAAKAAFILVKPQIDANNRRFVNGCKGGKPKTNQNVTKIKPNSNQSVTKSKPNVNVNVNVNDNENVNVNGNENVNVVRARFTPPTLDEVKNYCLERGNKVDAQRFIDFYSSKGWLIGKNKMKDWKAAVRTWERGDNSKPSETMDDFFRRKMGL